MRGPGILVPLVAASLCVAAGTAEARPASWSSSSKTKRALARKHRDQPRVVAMISAGQRRVAAVSRRGDVRVDGRMVRCGSGRVVGQPAWRPDGGALALLQRSSRGLRLCVVLLEPGPGTPLTWWLPQQSEQLTRVFWVGQDRVGVGYRALVPRIVVSWTRELL